MTPMAADGSQPDQLRLDRGRGAQRRHLPAPVVVARAGAGVELLADAQRPLSVRPPKAS